MLILQIGLFVGGLAFLYLFGDQIASGAGNLVSELTEPQQAQSGAVERDGGTGESGSPLPEKRRAPVLESPSSGESADASSETGANHPPPDTGSHGAQTD